MTRAVALAALLCLVAAESAEGQQQNCSFNAMGTTRGAVEAGVPIILIPDPFVVTCDDGVVVRASSGRINQSTREVYLYGDVFFEDPERTLTAREATYNPNTAYLWARQDVVFTDRVEGMSLRGPDLEYFRATESRPIAQMTATQRPLLTLTGKAGETREPIELVADRVSMTGEDDLSAFGSVVVTRPDLHATAGEARYNSTTENLELRQDALITSEDRELRGEVVQARLVDGALEHLRARSGASLQSEDLNVTGDDLQLFFSEEVLQRAVAVGSRDSTKTVAMAESPGFVVSADSLDAAFIDQQLSEVHAIGNARGESVDTTTAETVPDAVEALQDSVATLAGVVEALPDSVQALPDAVEPPAEDVLATTSSEAARTIQSDWVRGDTIVGYFSPADPLLATVELPELNPDTAVVEAEEEPAPSVEIRRLVASGEAQSLYRMRGENDPPGERRNINFLIGQRIELDMLDGELNVAQVTGLQYGVYLEAEPAPAVSPGPDQPAASTTGDV